MEEPGDIGALSTREALTTIERARAYEEPLRRRAEGVTWMIWGVVIAGIQLSFSARRDLVWPPGSTTEPLATPGWYDPMAVVGWLAVGMLLTFATWRIASLRAPEMAPKPRRTAIGGLIFAVFLFGSMAVLYAIAGSMPEALFPVLSIGAAWLGVGVLDLFETTDTGRRTLIATGASILLVGTIAAFLLPWGGFLQHSGQLTYEATAPVTILAGGGIPFLAGLWQSSIG